MRERTSLYTESWRYAPSLEEARTLTKLPAKVKSRMAIELTRIVTFNFVDMIWFRFSGKRWALLEKLPIIIDVLMRESRARVRTMGTGRNPPFRPAEPQLPSRNVTLGSSPEYHNIYAHEGRSTF